MAVIWERTLAGTQYRVTQAGASRRLYTNGVFHSQYNAKRPVAGNVWDLLFLPAFMHPQPQCIKRVLVLGVGGGAVIRQLQFFLRPDYLLGVEVDPVHVQIARRFFGVTNTPNTEIRVADAEQWLAHYEGEPFDIIIDDLFGHTQNAQGVSEPVRAIPANDEWLQSLVGVLSSDGVLVMNLESPKHLKKSACRNLVGRKKKFSEAYEFTCERYENAIAALVTKPLVKNQFLQTLAEFPQLNRQRKGCQLNFKYRRLPYGP